MKWKKGDFVYICTHDTYLGGKVSIGKAEVIQAGEKRLKLERYAMNSAIFGYKSVFDQDDPRLQPTAQEAFANWRERVNAEIVQVERRQLKLDELLAMPQPETEYRLDTIS